MLLCWQKHTNFSTLTAKKQQIKFNLMVFNFCFNFFLLLYFQRKLKHQFCFLFIVCTNYLNFVSNYFFHFFCHIFSSIFLKIQMSREETRGAKKQGWIKGWYLYVVYLFALFCLMSKKQKKKLSINFFL